MHAEAPAAPEFDTATVIHAYGIVRGGGAVAVPESGISGAGVALLDAGPIAAVFSRLCSTEYGEAAWRAHAEDARWLTEIAVEHQRVLDEIVEDADVLPLRLPAMYRDEAHLHDVLVAHQTLFCAALDAIHDHVEWGVQLFADRAPAPAEQPRPTSGRDFFDQRARAAAARRDEQTRRDGLVRDAYASLADVARQSVVNTPQDPALTGRREPMLLNSAHLVCRRHRDFFFAAIDELRGRLAPAGISVQVSGPWPPYNFVALGAEELEDRR